MFQNRKSVSFRCVIQDGSFYVLCVIFYIYKTLIQVAEKLGSSINPRLQAIAEYLETVKTCDFVAVCKRFPCPVTQNTL